MIKLKPVVLIAEKSKDKKIILHTIVPTKLNPSFKNLPNQTWKQLL